MYFFKKTDNSGLPDNEVWRISAAGKALRYALVGISGLALAMAFPPLNLHALAFVALSPMIGLVLEEKRMLRGALYGWIFGWVWILVAFWWLREIEWIVPFLLAPVLGLWSMVFFALLPLLYQGICVPVTIQLDGHQRQERHIPGFFRELFFALSAAGLYCFIDWTRALVFPWNYIGVTQWRNPAILQIAEWTGVYGINFLIVFVNIALALALRNGLCAFKSGKKFPRPYLFLLSLILLFATVFLGGVRIFAKTFHVGDDPKFQKFRFGVVQGDLSQRREANSGSAREALDIYMALSEKLVADNPDLPIIIWPETAVPYPYYGGHKVSKEYRRRTIEFMRANQLPMLIGSLDFVELADGEDGLTNAALLFDQKAFLKQKYEKIHRVPYGEFVPFRALLPEWLVKQISMGRDLVPGSSAVPLQVQPGVRAGIAVCYESIFAALIRREANLGANMLLVISNDAWYPTSSEPEQHLANAVIRSIESGLPSLRVGNNGGTLVVNRAGIVENKLMPNITDRGRAQGVLEVNLELFPWSTFYTRYGDLFLLLVSLMMAGGFTAAIFSWHARSKILYAKTRKNG